MFILLLFYITFYIESNQVVTWLKIGVYMQLSLLILGILVIVIILEVTYPTSGGSITYHSVQRGETTVLYLYGVD
jgi:hypothetical protein